MKQNTFPLPVLWRDPERGMVARIAHAIEAQQAHAARTVVLVPYAQLMSVARAMWAQCARPGFVPRFETTRNWARSIAGFVPGEDDIAFDRGRDLLTAQSLLARVGLGAARATLAPRVVDIALQLAPLAAAQLPQDRADWSQSARELVSAAQGSEWFGLEAALHSVAVAWAANSAYETDVLLGAAAAAQADLLVVLDGLQPDPLVQRLVALFGPRAVQLDLPAVQAELAPAQPQPFALHSALHSALDPEDEADRAAACVLAHVAAGRVPVALIATDRALTRRIGAQLAAHGLQPFDETGWKLSTTRAAATVMTALRACAHDASTDSVLDWLKGAPAFEPAATQALEHRLRELGVRDWSTWRHLAAKLDTSQRPGDAALHSLTQAAEAQRAAMTGARPLAQWLAAARELLQAGGQWLALADDVAGARLIDALHLEAPLPVPEAQAAQRWSLHEFVAWATDVLESVSAVLATLEQPDAAQVVVLPLQQLLGRSFAAVVLPGGDDQRLPASPEPPGEWTTAQRAALGLPSREMLEQAQRAAWRMALQAPHCDVLWRAFDAQGEPVRASALVQLAQLDGSCQPAGEPRIAVRLPVQPVRPPQPHGEALPLRALSASAYEDLRRCPYRFFALRQLGLRTDDELDAQIDKRDFGTWLHAVLGHFHEALHEAPTQDLDERRALIEQAVARATRELALSTSEFLPFTAAWPAVREGYLAWLAQHESEQGARFIESEADRQQPMGRITLRGRLDRIDRTRDGLPFVIDYKTESLETSKKRVAEPFEDTQLAFYAALLDDGALRAAYVNVGEKSSGTHTVEQHDVVAVRDALIEGLMDDMQRIGEGAALPALGEAAACQFCAARGLCRKDFWTESALPPVEAEALPIVASAAPAQESGSVSYVDAEAAYQHNGAHVARAAFYSVACDPRRSVAVEACAGAGKTWMLVSRVLRALLEEGEGACQPHEILAITFTKKAAGEMRARLDEWLAEFSAADLPKLERELQARGMGPAAAHAAAPRLQGLYRQLLEGGRPVQFRTFHAWFAGLLRNAPLAVLDQLGLPSNYQLLEDDSQARQRVWRPFFAAVVDDAEASADYHALVASHGRSQTGKALDEALTRRVEFVLADRAGAVDGAVRSFAEHYPGAAQVAQPSDLLCGAAAHAQWLAWARLLGAEANKTPQKAAAVIIDVFGAGPLTDASGQWGALRKAFFVAEEDRLTRHLEKYPAAQEAQAVLQLLCAAQRQHEAWLYHQRLARLTRLLIATFARVKAAHGWIDMNDVEQSAQLLLGNAQLWGWVQERLDAGVRHLMIDEFQDTNPLQWQALHGWLDGYAGAGGRAPSVFIVGDPKQSIYRFRRAEPQVFIAAKAFVREALQGEWLACDHTRRNARAVIGLVNGALQAAQAAGEFSDFRAHTTESTEDGRVRKLPPIERLSKAADDGGGAVWRDSLSTPRVLPEERMLQKECAQAARWIAERIAEGVAPGDVMVLARKRSRLAVMQDELRALHIATQQPEKNDLHDMPEVQDMVALLDVLVSTDHDLSLARALKSPLWRCDDAALVALALRKREAPARSWFELLQAGDLPPTLAGIGAQLLRWKGWVDSLPPHDALNAIYHDADVLARFAAAAPAPLRARMQANLRGLLAASLELDGARFASPYALVRALRAGKVPAPSVAAKDAVQLLTVHGAKGLEAEIVLLLDTHGAPQRAQTMGVLVKWPGQAPLPQRFVFIASEKHPPACAEADLAEEQAARQREEINGLYVATTRAREQLVISSMTPQRAYPQSWWGRLEGFCESIDAVPAPASDAPKTDEAEAPTFSALHLPALPATAQAQPARATRTPDSLASAMGQAMHRLLEWAAPGTPIAPAQLRAAAREFALDAAQVRHAAALAERIRAGAGGWAWTLAELDWHGNEVALVHEGRVLRIDRLVRERASGVWWVLDYKSASRPERDPELMVQMQRYGAAVRHAHPGAQVKVAFLTGQGEMIEVT